MHHIGVDIGSTATKVAVVDEQGVLVQTFVCPTGFSSVDAAERARELLEGAGYSLDACTVVATGYGRVAVPYAHKVVTEINVVRCTCSTAMAWWLMWVVRTPRLLCLKVA